ncbi:hypothetical protein DUD82_24815 [Bacillus toyonensis]
MQHKLKFYNIFPEFNQVYNELHQVTKDNQNSNESKSNHIILTLVYGVEHKIVTESNLDNHQPSKIKGSQIAALIYPILNLCCISDFIT